MPGYPQDFSVAALATGRCNRRVRIAMSMLCEHPSRRTGISTLFPAMVREAIRLYPQVQWLVFVGRDQNWPVDHPSVEVCRDFPSNERAAARLWADHFRVAAEARRRAANVLLTVGFHPARTAGLPVVMHVFSLRHIRGGNPRNWYRRWAVRRGKRNAELVIVNSRWTSAHLGPAPGRVLVSHEGLETQRFGPDGPRGGAGIPPDYLLWVGNFYRYKRAELTLAAYARLPADLRARLPLVFAGGDWEGGRGRVERAARRLGVTHDVRILGWVDDDALPALYRGARAHLLSTAEETFGRSVLEAMACGCPCVLQDLPVLHEVTAGAALFVDFTRVEEGVGGLRRICEDDSLAERLRADGLARARSFSYERMTRERLGAIFDMLARGQRERSGP